MEKYFRQAFELKIKGDKLPERQGRRSWSRRSRRCLPSMGARDALEAKECIVPVDNFKALRFAEMDLAQSLALENVGDKGLTECSVSTKGVRK